ncbi:hypothetical protein THIAE_04185 [Thiomicrospira aerophila AL3]|uniref:Glycosyltransferase subfamily 4-like N-terminal domain-containing protein n=1 Tax=Thiomicrospira aerophila AL3 TaxID=717772 RepID=W0DUH9_9GAMM|nr:hypothetical protein THIAE_04185 [Thiomicrospira aerophila AL3]
MSSKKIHFDISNIENIWFADKYYKKPIFGFMELQRKAQALDFQIKILEEKFGRFDLILARLYGTHRLFAKLNYEQVFYSIHSDPWVEATHNKNLSKTIKSIASFKRVYKNKKIVCVSKGIKYTLVNKFSLNEKDITIIYNPFKFEDIIKKSTEYKVEIEDDYIVHVGRFHPQKRHDILFESYKKMKTEHKLVL